MRFEDVSLRYTRRSPWILREVNLELAPGGVAVVVGRNGAGKTTLLSAAAGLLSPDRGRIADRPRRVGWVPERFPASQPFRLRDYLEGMAAIRGLSGPAATHELNAWYERLHLGPFLRSRLPELSKGTAQKVGIIQALVPHPDLLILDEPWEGLDAQTCDEIPAIIAEVVRKGGAVLVSDHLGELDDTPGALYWHVSEGGVKPGGSPFLEDAPRHAATDLDGEDDGEDPVIEISVPAADVARTVARLRADGHQVLRVRG